MIALLFDPVNYAVNLSAAPTFVTTAVLLFLGLLVLIRERASVASRLFFLMTLSASVWLFAFSWMYCAIDERVALWWAKTAYLGVPFIGPAIYHFTVAVLGLYARHRTMVWAGWILSALCSAVTFDTDALIAGLYQYWWGYYPRYGWFSVVFVPFFFFMMLASMRLFWREYRQAPPGTRKNRVKWFLLAFAGAFISSLDYVPKFGVPLYPFGYLPVLGWLAFVERAIWRYQLVEITPAFAADKIISTMADAMLVFDHEGVVRVVNQAACALFRQSEAELVGRPIRSINSGFLPREQIETLLRTGSLPKSGVSYVHRPDSVVTLDLSASVIRDRAGHAVAIVSIARDVTAHQQAVEALKSSEERFRSIAQSANDAIISVDSEGRILLWNTAAERIFGYQAEEVRGQFLTVLMPPRYHDAHRAGLERMRTTGESQVLGRTVELEGLRKDGSEFPVELSLSTWRVGDESFYSGIIRDVTERKQAEQALHESEMQLRHAQKMEAVGRLAGSIAHDFNNMLLVINGYSQLLLSRLGLRDPLREDLEHIKEAGDRAAALTQQLLAFSRRQVLRPKVLDLNTVVVALSPMLQRVLGEHINLATALEPALGHVKADPGQLEQVLVNLTVNARDAMPQGGKVTIETLNATVEKSSHHTQTIPPDPYVVLIVSDTGCGMDAETRARIFEPFFTTKEVGQGTGLGLSMVYGIVKQNSGDIVVYSEPGRGATFKIYLPRVDEPLDAIEPPHPSVALPRGTETILLVEDEPQVRAFVRDTLRQHGYAVLEARHGVEALVTAAQHPGPIHLLMTDVIMPQVSGPQVAQRLMLIRPDMKVLYMSGYTENAGVHHGVLDPGVAFLHKPFSLEALARKVREVLDASC